MQTRSLSRLLMIVSSAIAVLPVWRSPMISSRCPRPIGIMPSIAFSPVWTGEFTGWRWTTPGALNSAGRVSVVLTSPLSSSGRPSGSTIRPSSASPTGISSRRPVRLTVSPSTTLSHSPNRTTPTLSCSRLSARPAASVSSPSIRSRRILAISSGLISTWFSVSLMANSYVSRFLCRLSDFLSQSFQLVVKAGVQHHVADSQPQTAEDALVHLAAKVDLAVRLTLDLSTHVGNQLRVELDGARHYHLEAPVRFGPQIVEAIADPEDRRHPVLLREQLEEVEQLRLRAGNRARDPLALLRGGEVGAEQEHLKIAVRGHSISELVQLLVDDVELVLGLGGLEQRLGVYARDLLHYSGNSSASRPGLPGSLGLPFPTASPERAEKSTSARASSTSRFWSSASSDLRVTFSVASTVRSATSLR